ncbi:CBS domain-containing protein [Pseudoalteromonas xiamenensis]|uniref:magnesium transporter MgtE N-terminal domain-containing protein n=1 Tax=Pseudoalteromonas xiamenensis TaxID=882626 RepID=UPI0027E4506A|nr:CBS domain-containing protein [Pseudoalteromonas xiamenensis]WMN58570.1 CBS domain-containing protein [Pseudoalteromonas xiamenensis]
MSSLSLKLAQHFLQEEPAGAARRLELQSPEVAVELIKTLPLEAAIKVLKVTHPSFAAELFMHIDDVEATRWLDALNTTDIAAIFRHLDEPFFAQKLALLSLKKQTLCKMLVSYPEYTVGAWIEASTLVLDDKMSVEEVLLRLKKRRYQGSERLFVLNAERKLVGQVSLYDVLRLSPHESIAATMRMQSDALSGVTELAAALQSPLWKQTDCVAVVNRTGEFIGVLQHHRLRAALNRFQRDNQQTFDTPDLVDAYTRSIASLFELVMPSTGQGAKS